MCCHQISETAEFLPVASITRWICSSGSSRVAQPPPPPLILFLDQTEARRAEKKILRLPPPYWGSGWKLPRYLKVWIRLWFVTCGKKVDFSFRSCWIIGLRFLLSNSLERRQGSWRWKSLTDIKELQKCEILVSILVRQISVLPAGKKKNEKSCGSLVTFSQEHPSSIHTEPIYTSLPTMLRGRACSVRARQTRAREDGKWRRDPLTPASLQLPSLLVRSIEFCQALTRQTAKELLTIESKTDIVIDYMLIHA